ncbi:right-handed parallel beta-helix repeat-containing protein [Cognatitamlana onchidii]|uniref:right-handed parallel beta-helix repeat-containing protein n=1 Tax=Cognatitamlana onchidii TaxID=2562860 RepID=UPI0010A5A7A7|nr:right-handed parallel beta-helix repeat-containing protein [Algibacter onchidii]
MTNNKSSAALSTYKNSKKIICYICEFSNKEFKMIVAICSLLITAATHSQAIIHTGKTFDANLGAGTIRIDASNNGSRITNCTFINYKNPIISIIGATDVIIDNCRFIDAPGSTIDRDIHAINIGSEGHDIIVRNCTFRDIGADGFQCGHSGGNITNITIENNLFEVTKPRTGENGVDLKQTIGPIYIRNNVFKGFRPCEKDNQLGCTGSSGEGLVMHLGTKNVVIEGNRFTDCIEGIEIENAGDTEDVIIRNNIFHDNLEHGLNARVGFNLRVYNNTFVNNGIRHVRFQSNNITGANKNNFYVGNGSSFENNQLGGEGNLVIENVADAKFVDVSNHNYRIKSDSPAIDAGVEVGEVTKDLDGEERPTDGLYDVGADEYFASLGLADLSSNDIQLYPNPVKNRLYFKLKNDALLAKFHLTDLNGRIVYQAHSLTQNYIDVASIPSGIYFGYFTLNSKLLIKKIVKQ